MNRRTILAASAIATMGLAMLSLGQAAHAAGPTSAGTWDLNIAKSKSTDPLPKSITRTYEVTATSEKMTGTVVAADGKTTTTSFSATLDGKESPYQAPGIDTIALTKVDASTVSFVTKLAGKQVATGTRVLSPDGKSMTITQKGINPAGQPFESSFVYDRR